MLYTVTTYLFGDDPELRKELARKLGKKSTSSDITLYAYEKNFLLEVIDPIQFPAKTLVIFETANMLDVPVVMLPASGPNVNTGEFALLLEALDVKEGIVAVVHNNEYADLEGLKTKFTTMFKDLKISNYQFLEVNLADNEQIVALRESIREIGLKMYKEKNAEEPVNKVEVDHVFPVKGIGTVILGRVRKGEVSKGDKMFVLPSQRTCIVKSIQINDVDYNTAAFGSRVGLALRGLLPKDVKRGDILTTELEGWQIKSTLKLKLHALPFANIPEQGKTRHVIIGLQAVPALVSNIEQENKTTYELELELAQQVVLKNEDRIILIDLNGKPKTIGYGFLAE